MPKDDHYPHPKPLDGDLLDILREVCKSYQTFLRAFAKRTRNEATDSDPRAQWLLYLLILSYDIGFVSLAIIKEGLDRQLLTMKRQAFEYAVKAQYLFKFPEKALQQYQALPLKQRELLERMGLDEAGSEAAAMLAEEEARLKALLPEIQPKYGEVSMFDMLRAIDPSDYGRAYAHGYWLPSATIHGFQLGMLDALRRLPEGKLWLSNHSMLSTRNQNVCTITDSLIRVLVLTGHQFKLYGTHWVDLIARFNRKVVEFDPNSTTIDIPMDASALKAAAAYYMPGSTSDR